MMGFDPKCSRSNKNITLNISGFIIHYMIVENSCTQIFMSK